MSFAQATHSINMINIGVDCDVVAEAAKLKESPLQRQSGLCRRSGQGARTGQTYRMNRIR